MKQEQVDKLIQLINDQWLITWSNHYEPGVIMCDGYGWEIEFTYNDGKKKHIYCSNVAVDGFKFFEQYAKSLGVVMRGYNEY